MKKRNKEELISDALFIVSWLARPRKNIRVGLLNSRLVKPKYVKPKYRHYLVSTKLVISCREIVRRAKELRIKLPNLEKR